MIIWPNRVVVGDENGYCPNGFEDDEGEVSRSFGVKVRNQWKVLSVENAISGKCLLTRCWMSIELFKPIQWHMRTEWSCVTVRGTFEARQPDAETEEFLAVEFCYARCDADMGGWKVCDRRLMQSRDVLVSSCGPELYDSSACTSIVNTRRCCCCCCFPPNWPWPTETQWSFWCRNSRK